MAIKTITKVDADNFDVLAPFIGQDIDIVEYRKAIAGEKFTVGVEKKEDEEATEEAPKSEVKAKKGKK